MKLFKFTPLLLAFTLVACGTPSSSNQPTTGWNSTELTLINEHVYGIEIPYMHIDGNKQLYYEEELDMLLLNGAEIFSDELETYKNLFLEDEWTLNIDPLYDCFYRFHKAIEYEGKTKYVIADLYALKETYNEKQDMYYYDFSTEGQFYLNIYDHHYYEWPTDEFQALVQKTTGSEAIIPAYENASRYVIEAESVELGAAIIYAYTDAIDPEADYETILVNAGWEMLGNGLNIAVRPNEQVAVQFSFNQQAGLLAIAAVEVTPSTPAEPLDERLIDLVEQININFGLAGYDFRLEWDDYYSQYDVEANLGSSTDESEANLKAAAQTLIDLIPSEGLKVGYDEYNDPANGGEDILSDGTITYRYSLLNEEETFAIQIITFVFEGTLWAAMAAYSLL